MSKHVRIRNKVAHIAGSGQAADKIPRRRGGDLPRANSPAPPVDQDEEPPRHVFDDSSGPGGPDDVEASRLANLDNDVQALHEEQDGEPWEGVS